MGKLYTGTSGTPGNFDIDVLQNTIGVYTDEAYTNARKLSGTAIVGGNPGIDVNTETFCGQLRWRKPLNPKINIASLTNPAAGLKTNYAADFLQYIKTVRTHGAEKVNMATVVTQEDGLAKIGQDFGETRGQDEHNAILSILKGVAISEVLMGAASASGQAGLGGQTFENDPDNKRYGFYVDLGASAPIAVATAAVQGASRAEAILNAFGMAYKDYEPEFAYLIVSPATMASFRSANLVDSIIVTEGNINFNTLFGGKFRLIQTRASQGFTSAELAKINTMGGIDLVGTKTSFLVLPGAIAMESLVIPVPTEITRNGNSFNGGGSTDIWNRWGYVMAPAGYNWIGADDVFPSDADYMKVFDSDLDGVGAGTAGGYVALSAANNGTVARGTWERKTSSALSLGILPIFHS